MTFFLTMLVAYLLGSIPSAYLVGRFQGIDIRRYGSGNIGTTNAFRILGAVPALLVLLADVGKGALATYLGFRVGGDGGAILMGLLAILGHSFSPFVAFKGGKGVATGLGVFLVLSPWVALIELLLFAAIVAATRYVSLASLVGAAALPVLLILYDASWLVLLFAFVAAAFIWYRHIPNLKRLLNGTEAKIGEKGHRVR